MPTPWSEVFAALGDRLDETVLPRLYEAASLSTAEIRAELDREGLRRFDPGQPDLMPSGEELRSSVDAVRRRS